MGEKINEPLFNEIMSHVFTIIGTNRSFMDSKYTDLIERSISELWTLAIQYAPKLFLAILTLIIGLWLIKRLNKGIRKVMDKRDMEELLKTFLISLVGIIIKT